MVQCVPEDEDMTQLLTVKDTCRKLQIGRTTLYRWMDEGKISYTYALGHRGFRPAEIERIRTDREKK